MLDRFDALWDGSGLLGSARHVTHTNARLVIRASDETTGSDLLGFRQALWAIVDGDPGPLHRIWGALRADGIALDGLSHTSARRAIALAESRGLIVDCTWIDLGGTTFYDHQRKRVEVPAALSAALLQRMRRSGCRVEHIEVD